MTQSSENPTPSTSRKSDWLWLGLLLVYMLLVGLYTIGRSSGRWAESDSAAFAQFIRVFSAEGRLVPIQDLYPNGYAFQAISTFILALTGLDVATLQQRVYPLIAFAIVLPAWLMYHELTGSARGATLAAILLLVQPEFLFVILRSSHEKFTRSLVFICLFLLLHSLKVREKPLLFASHVLLFYLVSFALVASNNLLAHSFIVSLAITFALGWFMEKRKAGTGIGNLVQRFLYMVLICAGLVYMLPYAYPPAGHDLLVFADTWNRIAALLLDLQSRLTVQANPYAYVASGWISLPAYLAVSAANWVILVMSFVIWVRQGVRWFAQGQAPGTQAARLLWMFYAAFAFQGGLSIVVDLSGALGSNLQHRLFPSFSIMAAGVVASALDSWRPRPFDSWVKFGLALGICFVAVLSVLKATNEPALSNKWTFYRQSELAALEWTDEHLIYSHIGTDFDERLGAAFLLEKGESAHNNSFEAFMAPGVRSLLVTQVNRLRGARLQQPIPVPPDAFRVYDNGEAQLYRLAPQTPYQR